VASSLRPDICVYSPGRKKVVFVELTSPFEENIRLWKAKKQLKYAGLVDDAKSNGWDASCLTIEVGARGFVSLNTQSLFRFFGLTPKDSKIARKEISKVAIRCSHFIWISRCNPKWSHPARVLSVLAVAQLVLIRLYLLCCVVFLCTVFCIDFSACLYTFLVSYRLVSLRLSPTWFVFVLSTQIH
jgi:hypothetical protein